MSPPENATPNAKAQSPASLRFVVVGDGGPAVRVQQLIQERGFGADQYPSDKGHLIHESAPFDWLLSMNNTHIFTEGELKLAAIGALNLHPAPLPEYAGLYCHLWGLEHGLEEWATTVHFIEVGVDVGDIVLKPSFPIETDDPRVLFVQTMKQGIMAMETVIDWIVEGRELPREPQDLSKRRVYTRKMAKDAGLVENP